MSRLGEWLAVAGMVAGHVVLAVLGLVLQLVVTLALLGAILTPVVWLVRLFLGAGR